MEEDLNISISTTPLSIKILIKPLEKWGCGVCMKYQGGCWIICFGILSNDQLERFPENCILMYCHCIYVTIIMFLIQSSLEDHGYYIIPCMHPHNFPQQATCFCLQNVLRHILMSLTVHCPNSTGCQHQGYMGQDCTCYCPRGLTGQWCEEIITDASRF